MAIHDHADERAHKFYKQGFVGSKHGDNGSSYQTSWNTSHEELEPTMVYATDRHNICGYCGHGALPIQAGLRRPRSIYRDFDDRSYDVTGYTCCCAGAMDEREHQVKVKALQERHAREQDELMRLAPKPSRAAFEKVLTARLSRITEDAVRFFDGKLHSYNGAGAQQYLQLLSKELGNVPSRVCEKARKHREQER